MTNPVPLKAALALQGWDVGTVRLPLSTVTDDIKDALQKILSDLSLLPQ
jgi:4-hydroxy-tetrahydrodipicolinate synthase